MQDKKPDPNSPDYRKPVMVGSTAGLKQRGLSQFPEYTAWLAKREERQS